VDPKLKELAKEVSNREPALTGYRLGTIPAKRSTSAKRKSSI